MIDAIICDFDGLILDTETPDYECWRGIYAELGCELMLEDWVKCIGTQFGDYDPFADLENKLGHPVDRDGLTALHSRRFNAVISAQPPMPGVCGLLADAAELNLALGLASSSPRAKVLPQLERLKLTHYFKCIRCAEDVEHVKPAPDLYRAVVEMLGVSPSRAVALEDSPNGIKAAKSAGLFCIAAPNAMTRLLDLDGADMRIYALDELPLRGLLTSVEHHLRSSAYS